MKKARMFTIVHIEDEPFSWKAVPRAVREGLYDLLSEGDRESLAYMPPEDRSKYPTVYTIKWKVRDQDYELYYWMVVKETIEDISDKVKGEPTFIIDVMRTDAAGAMVSTLRASIASVKPFVQNWAEQVRVLTAFAIPETDVGVLPPLKEIPKADQGALVPYLLKRIQMFPM
jgi:hypothetical protein